jgi:hypothetical protein
MIGVHFIYCVNVKKLLLIYIIKHVFMLWNTLLLLATESEIIIADNLSL